MKTIKSRVRFLLSLSLLLTFVAVPILAKAGAEKRAAKRAAKIAEKRDKETENGLRVEVAYGEFIDKITILLIKTERIDDEEKLKNVRNELNSLMETYRVLIPSPTNDLKLLEDKIKRINEALWEIEDAIRDKERAKAFDAEFVKLARSVYYVNDERCKVKRQINELLGSSLVEEKSYKDYK